MKKIIILLFTLVTTLSLILPGTILATDSSDGNLEITWDTSPGGPIFSLDDFKPGDCVEKTVKVKNGKNQSVKVFGVNTVSENSILPDVTNIQIWAGSTSIYGPKTLNQFFLDSAPTAGLYLSTVPAKSVIIYKFKACFDINAGNDYQKLKVVFDLTFGINITAPPDIKINEVYYDVDPAHGLDSPKDRGVSDHGSFFETELFDKCFCIDKFPKFRTFFRDFDHILGDCGKKRGQNDEWVELYNPTDHDISLKNWSLTDDSGEKRVINAKKIIKSHGFALISKDASTWTFWNEDPNSIKIELGSQIGNGLGDGGDHLILKNPDGDEVDFTAWESDHYRWNPSVPDVPLGSSIERSSPGFDNNVVGDWLTRTPPTPGH